MTPIGIAGLKGSGKDTAARILMSHWHDQPWQPAAFADPIKAISRIFGFTDEQMTNPAFKEQEDGFWKISWRKFATMVGTDLFRNCWRNDVWVRLAERRMLENPDSRFLFTDVRYDNEAMMVKRHGGYVLRIDRPVAPRRGRPLHKHASELGVSSKWVDHAIANDGTLVDLHDAICDIVDDYLYPNILKKENIVYNEDHA